MVVVAEPLDGFDGGGELGDERDVSCAMVGLIISIREPVDPDGAFREPGEFLVVIREHRGGDAASDTKRTVIRVHVQ